MSTIKVPTAEELYALEMRARRARSDELARLVRKGYALARERLKGAFGRTLAPAKGVRHA